VIGDLNFYRTPPYWGRRRRRTWVSPPAVSRQSDNVECVHVRDGHAAMLPPLATMLESSCHLATSRDDL